MSNPIIQDNEEYCNKLRALIQAIGDDYFTKFEAALDEMKKAHDEMECLYNNIKQESDEKVKLIGTVFPALIALSFVPSSIAALPSLEDQNICFWLITSLLVFATFYLFLFTLCYSILPPRAGKIQLRSKCIQVDLYLCLSNTSVDEETAGRSLTETANYIWDSYLESQRFKNWWNFIARALKYTRILFIYDQYLHLITLLLSIAIVLCLLISEKTVDFDRAGLAQLYYTAWILPMNVLITLITRKISDDNELGVDKPSPV